MTLGFSDYTTTHCNAKMKQNLGRGNTVQCRIDLEPITRCILMDWWHPEYPRLIARPNYENMCSTEDW